MASIVSLLCPGTILTAPVTDLTLQRTPLSHLSAALSQRLSSPHTRRPHFTLTSLTLSLKFLLHTLHACFPAMI